MAILLTMPSLSPTMEVGVISTWNKQPGDLIDVGDVIAEIETDKAIMEFESADEGVLREILVDTGIEIAVEGEGGQLAVGGAAGARGDPSRMALG